jgi:alkylation response protein AidB-like acyl-CoA dehydrogenase
MEFGLSEVQRSWAGKARALGRELADEATAADVVMGAARVGLVDTRADLLAAAVAVEALACESAAAALAFALHTGVVLATAGDGRFSALARGEVAGAIGLSSDDMPNEQAGRLTGRASWVGPLTDHGVALIGARSIRLEPEPPGELGAFIVRLDVPGVTQSPEHTAALRGFVCGHLALEDVEAVAIGSPIPVMARVRVLLAAAGLGMGRRALHEALHAAKRLRGRGAGGEQTVQGLLADAATELDAAMLLTWKAAAATTLSLAEASMAKLAATEATQRAVARATQVVGADTFRRGHIVERLAQDVRALELFAGRTEALREAVAGEVLPQGATA